MGAVISTQRKRREPVGSVRISRSLLVAMKEARRGRERSC